MKRIVSIIVTLCLVLSCTAVAFAKAGPTIVKQPESQTTDAKGKVTFECKVKNATSITWYFVDPATGEKTSARNIGKLFKGIGVRGPNGQKLSLSKVPDALHGWSLYCHIFGNGYQLDSDTVQLFIYGKETEASAEQPATEAESVPAEEPQPEPEPAPAEEPQPEAEIAPAEQPTEEQPAEAQIAEGQSAEEQPAEDQATEKKSSKKKSSKKKKSTEQTTEQTAEQATEQTAEQPAEETVATAEVAPEPADVTDVGPKYEVNEIGEAIIPDKEITVSATDVLLYPVDARGNLMEGEAGVSAMTFVNTGEFYLKADAPIKYVTFNGIRFQPAEPVTSIKLSGVSDDLFISAKLDKGLAEGELDYDNMCAVTCEGCTFTFRADGLTNVTSGQVPAGASITVLCTERDKTANGYIINGGEAVQQGKASFKLTITENTTIAMAGQ